MLTSSAVPKSGSSGTRVNLFDWDYGHISGGRYSGDYSTYTYTRKNSSHIQPYIDLLDLPRSHQEKIRP